jgi:hypothetical protein
MGSPISSSIRKGHKDFLVIDNNSSFKHSTKILSETEKSDVPTDDDNDDDIRFIPVHLFDIKYNLSRRRK